MADFFEAKRVAFFLPDLGGGGAERVALASINDLVARYSELLTKGDESVAGSTGSSAS